MAADNQSCGYTEKTAPEVTLPPGIGELDDALGAHLFDQGWVTVSVLSLTGNKSIGSVRFSLMEILQNAPEFVEGLTVSHRFALTGFAALPYPSSFHNVIVRDLRKLTYAAAKPILTALATRTESQQTHMDQYLDRMMVRQGKWPGDKTGQKATAEAWHRDESIDEHGKAMPDDDAIFGGWLNLNDTNESFLCAPGTHFKDRNMGSGFGLIKDAEERRKLYIKLRRVIVPPGHMLIFFENMAHLVASKGPPAGTTQMRLFTGFRLTNNPAPVYSFLEETLRTMDVMRLKSGQMPPTYSKLNWVNFPDQLEEWTLSTLVEQLHETKRRASGERAGEEFTIPVGGPFSERPMIPLRRNDNGVYVFNEDLVSGFSMEQSEELEAYFPNYTDEELDLYRPQPLNCRFGIGSAIGHSPSCASCGLNDAWSRCSACNSVYYCNEACQKADWHAGHRFSCGSSSLY